MPFFQAYLYPVSYFIKPHFSSTGGNDHFEFFHLVSSYVQIVIK